MKLRLKKYLLYSSVVLIVGGLTYLIVESIILNRTGFETKTLWDWMELLIVPLVLAGGAFYLNQSERSTEREISNDRQQEAALQTYFDRMAELLLIENLRTTKKIAVRDVARTRTVSILRVLSTKRINLVIQFLREANLVNDKKSILQDAIMTDMNLKGVNLRDLNLEGVNLEGANMAGANLEQANLDHANLQRANLQHAKLFRVWMKGAELQNTNLLGADLTASMLGKTNLQNANFQNANLSRACLSETMVSKTNFQNALLWGADLTFASLTDAKFKNADLLNADFRGAKILGLKQFADAKSMKGTIMTDGKIYRKQE